jgi:class 3 adenylate cyclase
VEVAEQIELATILLTDLVGSTRLATAIGPVRADELRDEHFAVLREAIGVSGGKEVKNTGDGLMVAFASASAAVRCAVQMQQLFDQRYRKAEQQLHIRIGMGAGESTVQDGDYFGMPSIEAARLCDKAPSDGILVSSLVQALAGRLEGVAFESVGELELKGFNEPVEAFAVPWEPAGEEGEAPGAWPLPAVLRSVPVLSYVGREAERGVIERAQSEARGGARQVVLLSGDPGIGKSRLAAYAALGAHREGSAVVWGSCSEDLGVPYEPWITACSELVEHAPMDVLAGVVDRHGGEVSRLARGLRRRVPEMPAPQASDPETERFLLFSAVAGLLTELSRSVPVVLVLDDFHWADGQSVALLKHIARATEQSALEVIVTYRESDLGKDHPLSALLADLHRVPGVERIALHGLGADEVAQILAAAAGHELDEDGLELAGEIAIETGGNPFFVGEVLRSLLESGRLLYDEETGRWRVDRSSAIGLPQSVREVVERRVERLGDETRQVLTTAAVIGRSFDVELLVRLVDVGEARLLDHLEAAVAASLLDESTEEVGRFRFVHALINQTLYEALGATRRARIHHAVGEAMEEVYGVGSDEHLGELALHWRLATVAVDRPKAAAYAARAGQQALDRLAPAEAARLFGDAVELLGAGDTIERGLALIGLGEAQRLIGDAAFRETLLEASRIASVLEEGELAGQAALANIRGLPTVIGATDDEHLAAIERALELDDGSDPSRRARLLAIQALELSYDPAHVAYRRQLAEEAVGLARDSGDPGTLAGVLRDVTLATISPDTLASRVALADELERAAEKAQDPALELWAADCQWIVSEESGERNRAAEALARKVRLGKQLGQPMARWFAGASAAAAAIACGDLAEGELLAEEAAHLGQDGDPVNAALY